MKILNDITGCVEKSVKFYDKSVTKRLFLKIINLHSCNKVTTQIQISHQNWNGFFSNISHQMMIYLLPFKKFVTVVIR